VGTNDLVQYTLAVDRTNPRVAHLASALHPAVLSLLDLTAKAAKRANIELAMCGGMAADTRALPLVMGLGYDHLSVDVGYLPLARAIIERIDMTVARSAAQEALTCASTDEVKTLIRERFLAVLGDLWTEQGLDLG
jgi:phosphoenolpyruvate-protein kinase (PTS system EI component)